MRLEIEKDSVIDGVGVHAGDIVYLNDQGQFHRLDGPAHIQTPNSNFTNKPNVWYKNGKIHRSGGPAIVFPVNHEERWCKNRVFHRLDGPAITNVFGTDRKCWWIKGIDLSDERNFSQISRKRLMFLLARDPEAITACYRSDYEMQDLVLKQRPDLIGKIKDLNPEIAIKYKHELDLSKVDI